MNTRIDARLRAATPGDALAEDPAAPLTPLQAYERAMAAVDAIAAAAAAQRGGTELLGLLDEGLGHLLESVGARDGSILVADEASGNLTFVVTRGDVPADKLRWRQVPKGYGVAGWVAEHGRPLIVNDTQWDQRFCDWFDEELGFRTRNILAAPLRHRQRILGVVELLNKADGRLFTNGDQSLASVFGHVVGDALDYLSERGESTIV